MHGTCDSNTELSITRPLVLITPVPVFPCKEMQLRFFPTPTTYPRYALANLLEAPFESLAHVNLQVLKLVSQNRS